MIQHLKIGPRLGLLSAVLLLLMAALAALTFVATDMMYRSLHSVYNNNLVPLQHFERIGFLMQRNRVLVMDVIADPSPNRVQALQNEYRQHVQTIEQEWQAYLSSQRSPTEVGLADAYHRARMAYLNNALTPMFEAAAAGNNALAMEIYNTRLGDLARQSRIELEALINYNRVAAGSHYEATGRLNQWIDRKSTRLNSSHH